MYLLVCLKLEWKKILHTCAHSKKKIEDKMKDSMDLCMCAYLLRKGSNDACEKFDISQTEQCRTNDSHLFLLSTG